MIRKEAVKIIGEYAKDNPIISANGFISRDLFELLDKDSNFYMIGSMGLSSSIALGVALKNPKKKVFSFDGDGNLLMNLGTLVTIGSEKPQNLIHVIFDNEVHESTGGQPTNLKKIDLVKIARASNYKVFKAITKKQLDRVLKQINRVSGPILLIIKIERSDIVSKRVAPNPNKIRERFMVSIKRSK